MSIFLGYIDPGTGATITQLLLAGTVGVAAVVKLKWHSIRSFFSRSKAADDSAPEVAPVEDEDLVP